MKKLHRLSLVSYRGYSARAARRARRGRFCSRLSVPYLVVNDETDISVDDEPPRRWWHHEAEAPAINRLVDRGLARMSPIAARETPRDDASYSARPRRDRGGIEMTLP